MFAVIFVLILPRKYVLVPVLAVSFLITFAQQVVVAGLHFQVYRIVILAGWIRLIARDRAALRFHWNAIDRLVASWAISSFVFGFLLWLDSRAIITGSGMLYSIFGVYFLARALCRNTEDCDRLVIVFSAICMVLATSMLIEKAIGRNLFSYFGGVPEYTVAREGKLRAQGTFESAICAGIFGAVLLPLFVGLWQIGKYKTMAAAGAISATIITITSASSSPIMAYLAGVGGLCMWPLRKRMRLLRWSVVIVLIALELVMKAPVWALIARFDVVGGSSGFHRYILVDAFIRHFTDWWVTGYRHPELWDFYTGDIANMYVLQGVSAGLVTFILFLAIVVYCYKRLGHLRKSLTGIREKKRVWSLGAALFAHLAAFMGISYTDQSQLNFYILLAIISAVTSIRAAARFRPRPVESVAETQLQMARL
jgi:hypothetical protein